MRGIGRAGVLMKKQNVKLNMKKQIWISLAIVTIIILGLILLKYKSEVRGFITGNAAYTSQGSPLVVRKVLTSGDGRQYYDVSLRIVSNGKHTIAIKEGAQGFIIENLGFSNPSVDVFEYNNGVWIIADDYPITGEIKYRARSTAVRSTSVKTAGGTTISKTKGIATNILYNNKFTPKGYVYYAVGDRTLNRVF